MTVPDRLLFGQFLIDNKKTSPAVLEKALEIQKIEHMSDTPRMLGNILLNDFKTFKDRVELQHCLRKFDTFQLEMKNIFLEAKKYGADPVDKLQQEYADLLEELEAAPTAKIREAIIRIEKFRVDIKSVRRLKEENEILREDNNAKYDEIEKLKYKVESLNNNLKKKDNIVKKYERFLRDKGWGNG